MQPIVWISKGNKVHLGQKVNVEKDKTFNQNPVGGIRLP